MISKKECTECAKESVRYDLYLVFFLTIFKLIIAQLTGSIALGASSLLSLGDFFTKIINMISVRVSKLHPSEKFPYGYGKIQFFTSVIIGFVLILTAIILLHNNFEVLNEPNSQPPGWVALIAIILTASASEVMYRYLSCVANRNDLSNIKAAALDHRMDVFSSSLVLVGLVLSYLGWEDADFWTAVLVSIFVFYIAIQIIVEAMKQLLDISLNDEIIDEIYTQSLRVKGVISVDYCRGRSLGETWELNLQLAIDEELSSKEINQLIIDLKQKILSSYPRFSFMQISHSLVANDEELLDKDILELFKQGN